MASHLEIGKQGEKLAEVYLAERGYRILHRNWRYGRFELDLVATKNELLRVVEVKFRTGSQFGQPEDAVTKKKVKSLLQAVEQFLFLYPQYNDFRLDVLSITEHNSGHTEYFLIEDVTL